MRTHRHYVFVFIIFVTIASLTLTWAKDACAVQPRVAAGGVHTVGLKPDGTAVAVGRNDYGQCDVSGWSGITQVAGGYGHTVGLTSDGTAVAVGYDYYGQCDVSGWSGITQVAGGYDHTVGLTSDGTVVAVGENTYGQCSDAESWSDIIQVSAGGSHTVGLKSDGTVVAVGNNGEGQCNVSWSGTIQIAAGGNHTVGLKSDGTVMAVGYNYYGQCNVSSWTSIVQVSAGRYITVGLKSDGTVVAVGDNGYGQCNVSGWTDVIQITAGWGHTVGLKSDGTVVAVGMNGYNQCDVGSWSWNDIIEVAAGDYHSVGLKSDGTVVAVGENGSGQCNVNGWSSIAQIAAGNSHTVARKSDDTVVAAGDSEYGQCNVSGWSGITQIAVGSYHTVGLKSDGTVAAVGYNYDGECNVSGWTDIVQVAAGAFHTVGLKSDGTVVAVGDNYYGECNVGSWTDITQVAAGYNHTVGLKSDGTVVAVGDNEYGQCDLDGWSGIDQIAAGGYRTLGLKPDGTVVAVGDNSNGECNVGSWTNITQVAAGGFHTVGLTSDGTVVAVGYNYYSQCNVATWTSDGITQVAAGGFHTMGLEADGTVVAVGWNGWGQCNMGGWTDISQIVGGYSHTVGLEADGTVVAVGYNDYNQCEVSAWSGITQVSAGMYHTVGLKSDGTVVAVGSNGSGQCNVSGWSGITQVAAGGVHTVGLKSDGTVVAVGDNTYGQCDVSSWTDITQVSAGDFQTVGLKSNGTVVAVGYNGSGQCNVSGWTNIVQVAAGDSHTVGLKSDGTVVAVGDDSYGQCNVGGWSGITQVSAGMYHTVGLKSDGTVVAVGRNDYGQCDVGPWNATPPCTSCDISATSALFTSSGGTGSVNVTADACSWTAVSSDEWITITAGESGEGNGTVNYSVDATTSSSGRMGTITIADKTFTVDQSGVNGESWSDNFEDGPWQDWILVYESTESYAEFIGGRYKLGVWGEDYTDWIGAAVNISADDCTIQATVAELVCDGCDCFAPVLGLRISRSALNFYALGVVVEGDVGITIGIRKRFGGEFALLNWAFIPGLDMLSPFYMKFSAEGTMLYGKAWNVGDPEPSEWMVEAEDADIPSGSGGIAMTASYNCTVSQGAFDDVVFTVAAPPPTDPPVADAGIDQHADEGGLVTLDGSSSYDNGEIVSYQWMQTGGPEVELSDPTAVSPTFTAPSVTELTTDLTFQLTVTDNDDLQDTDTCVVTVYNVNVAPVADAGADQTVNEGVLVTLNGSNSSDPDGEIASWQWTQTAGTAVILSNPAAVSPTFTAPSVGTGGASLTFRLTVTDNGGVQALQDTDTCIVNVSNVNQAPIANAGPNQAVDEGVLVTLNGSGSTDSDGTIDSYLWTQTAGPEVTLSDPSAMNPTFTSPSVEAGSVSLTFELRVRDNGELQDTDTCIVNVSNANLPPVADAGPDQTVDEGVLVTLDGSASTDPDGTVASWQWTQTGGTAVTLSDPSDISPTFTSPIVGVDGEALTFQLTVTDDGGLQDTDTCIVNVSYVNLPPVADAGPDRTVDQEVEVTLDGSGSTDSDGTIVSYHWEQTGGPSVFLSDPASAAPVFTTPLYEEGANVLTFTLTVRDDGGLLGEDTCVITVFHNDPPETPLLTGPEDGAIFVSGDAITLTAGACCDPEGDAHIETAWMIRRIDRPTCEYACTSSTELASHVMTELPPGLQYAWKVGYKDAGSGLFSWSEEWTFSVGPPIVDTSVSVPTGFNYEDYRMASFTVWPDDPAATSVFGIVPDTTALRIAGYDPTLGGAGGYREYGNPDLFIRPGSSYWFLVRGGIHPAIDGIAVSLDVDIDIPLLYNASAANGWNMIAPPNGADYKWEDIQVLEYDAVGTIIQGPIRIGDLSYENTMIDKRLWRWESGTYYSDTAELEKYAGYWLKARKSNVWLRFPADAHLASANITKVYVAKMMKEAAKYARAWGLTPAYAIAEVSDTPPMPPGEFTGGGSHFSAKEGGGCFITTTRAH